MLDQQIMMCPCLARVGDHWVSKGFLSQRQNGKPTHQEYSTAHHSTSLAWSSDVPATLGGATRLEVQNPDAPCMVYMPTLGWFEGSMGRHIWQSHGVYGKGDPLRTRRVVNVKPGGLNSASTSETYQESQDGVVFSPIQ